MIDLTNTRFSFDKSSVCWQPIYEANEIFLRAQQNFMNNRLKARGHVFLNEVLDSLGLNRVPAGQLVGWMSKENAFIDFNIKHIDEGILLDFNVDGIIYDKI